MSHDPFPLQIYAVYSTKKNNECRPQASSCWNSQFFESTVQISSSSCTLRTPPPCPPLRTMPIASLGRSAPILCVTPALAGSRPPTAAERHSLPPLARRVMPRLPLAQLGADLRPQRGYPLRNPRLQAWGQRCLPARHRGAERHSYGTARRVLLCSLFLGAGGLHM